MMRTRACSPARLVSALAVAGGALLAPSLAHAQFDLHDQQTGAEASIHLGYGAFSNDAAFRNPGSSGSGSLLGSFGMQFFLGYRVIPVLSAGLHGGYNLLAVRNAMNGQAADSGAFGIYARVHVLSFLPRRTNTYAGTPDLFIGVGFDFFAQVKAWDANNNYVQANGLAFPLQVGFNYAITDNVEVGVLGIAAPWTGPNGCVRVLGFTSCTTRDAEAEWFLYIGLGVTGHFNFLH